MPGLDGAIGWLNSTPLSSKSLRGKVVLVNFWTYTCINSLRPLPYVKNWASKYHDAGFVVIGVHTPEFSFEHEPMNVENAVRTLSVVFPVAIDSKYEIWQSFNNQAWPAQYLVDAKGQIRYHHFGEGDYVPVSTKPCSVPTPRSNPVQRTIGWLTQVLRASSIVTTGRKNILTLREHPAERLAVSGIKYDLFGYGLDLGRYRVWHFGHSTQ